MTRHHTTNVPFPIISFCCSLDTRTHTHNGFYLASDQKYHNPLFVKNRLPFLNIWFFIGMQACFLTQSNAFNTKHTHTHTFTLPSQLLAPELLTTYMFTTQHVPWPHNMCSPHNMHMCSPHSMHMCSPHNNVRPDHLSLLLFWQVDKNGAAGERSVCFGALPHANSTAVQALRLAECRDDLLTLRVPTTWERM